MKTVYLAGPISYCTKPEATDWRQHVARAIAQVGIIGISPLRCEPIIGDRYLPNNPDPKFGTSRAIGSKNVFDVRNCDMTLAFMPRELNDRRPSYGTVGELAAAYIIGKPTILVTDCPVLTEHPVMSAFSSWLLRDLDEAIEVIIGVLGDYARPLGGHY